MTDLDLSDAWVRDLVRQQIRLRSSSDGREISFRSTVTPEGVVTGLATTWGNEYPIGHGRSERVVQGAFRDDLALSRTRALCWQHDWSSGPIGVARFHETTKGLEFSATLYVEDQRIRNIQRAVNDGAVIATSIGFLARSITYDGNTEVIEQADLIEVSLVLRPANPQALITSSRSLRSRKHSR